MEIFLENIKREKRAIYMVQIRKENNEKLFTMKRNNLLKEFENHKLSSTDIEENFESSEEIEKFFIAYKKKDIENTIEHLCHLRKNISNSQNKEFLKDIDLLIEKGVLSTIVEILESKHLDHPLLMQEASWCLSNMVGSTDEHVSKIAKSNAINVMMKLFISSNIYSIIDNCLYFFGNLAGDNISYRSQFLAEEFVLKMLNVFELYKNDENLMKNFMWLMFCISRGRPYPTFAFFKRMFHVLQFMIFSPAKEILRYTLSVLINASDCDELTLIGFIISSGIIFHCLPFLKSTDEELLALALKFFNNLSYGSDNQTRILVDANILPYLHEVLKNDTSSKYNKRIAAFTLSNLMCSEPYQLQQCLDNKELVTLLVEMIHREPQEIAKECLMCFTNATFRGTFTQMCFLIENGIFNIFLEALSQPINDFTLIDEILQALINILNMGLGNLINGHNLFKEKLEQLGFLRVLESVMSIQNANIHKTCLAIVDGFFEESSVVFQWVQN